jgi:hypothetical protein
VRFHVEHHLVGLGAHAVEEGVARFERVVLAVDALQVHAQAKNIGEQQRRRIHEHGFALRMLGAGHRGCGHEAGREGGGHGAALGRIGVACDVVGVQGHHLHQVFVHAAELEHLGLGNARPIAEHQTAEEKRFADALRDLGREEEGFVEVFRLEFEPDLVILLPERDQPVELFRVFDDGGKRRRRSRRRRRCGWRGRRCCAGRRLGAAGCRCGGRGCRWSGGLCEQLRQRWFARFCLGGGDGWLRGTGRQHGGGSQHGGFDKVVHEEDFPKSK